MKPDWDDLGEKYENSKKVLIGDVDCTAEGEPLCKKYGVEGYPTLLAFNPPNYLPEKYEGERSKKDLKKFIKTLGPACTVSTLDVCKPKQLEKLQPYLDMDPKELKEKHDAYKLEIDSAQEKHDALMKSLQAQYSASEAALKELKEAKEPELKLMSAAIKPETTTEAKDEM